MVKCPNCQKELSKPEKTLKNCVFQVDAYSCDACGNKFKVTEELFSH